MPQLKKGKKAKGVKKRKGRPGRRRRLKALDLNVHQWIRFFSFASVLLMGAITLAAIMAFNHYRLYPGRVERDSVRAELRGADFISLEWDETHNTDVYKIFYKEHTAAADESAAEEAPADDGAAGETEKTDAAKESAGSESADSGLDDSWTEVESYVPEVKIDGLKENTSYSFIVRADSAKKEGIATEPRNFSTKKPQTIEVRKRITKLTCNKPFKLKAYAQTNLMYETTDPEVASVDPETDEIVINGPGTAEIKVKAKSSYEFAPAEEVVELQVIESDPVSAGGASARVIYHLDSDNCEIVKTVTGAGGAVVPQGLAYTGDKYIISYGMGSPNRIVSFDVKGDGKSVSVPKISLGHPNGFTYADENARCYCVKGWSSKAVTYEPTSDSYGSVNLSYGCSGIGYDRKEKLLYTCSRTAMVAYDISDGYSIKYRTGVVKHRGTIYTQDCGGHAGILLRCLSGSSKHGTNYIDLYDMKNGRYLGTLSCDLSEVESCIVDNEGFLEILANNTSSTDYIWKTDINIETIGEGL